MLFVILGDSEVSSMVIKESEAEGEEARQFLEEVRVTFPQVCVLTVKHPSMDVTCPPIILDSSPGCMYGCD